MTTEQATAELHAPSFPADFDGLLAFLAQNSGLLVPDSPTGLLIGSLDMDCCIPAGLDNALSFRSVGTGPSPADDAIPSIGADLGPFESCWLWYDGPRIGSCIDTQSGRPALYHVCGETYHERASDFFGPGAVVVSGAEVVSLTLLTRESVGESLSLGTLRYEPGDTRIVTRRWCGVRLPGARWIDDSYAWASEYSTPGPDFDPSLAAGAWTVEDFPGEFHAILSEFERLELEASSPGKTPSPPRHGP